MQMPACAADTAAEPSTSWPDAIFEILERFDVRQVAYVPDAGIRG